MRFAACIVALCCILCVFFGLRVHCRSPDRALAGEYTREKTSSQEVSKPPAKLKPFVTPKDSRPGDTSLPVFVATMADTYVVAEFTFDDPVGPDPQGWTSVDRTGDTTGVMWHVDTFMIPGGGGTQAMWCGVLSDSGAQCGYGCLPGYGNNWEQVLETPTAFQTLGDVVLSFDANWDTEPGYDYVDVFYLDKYGDWRRLERLDGQAADQHRSYVIPESNLTGSVKFQFHFRSDRIWSDEDCLYDTNGAIQLDNIGVADSTGTIHFEDFEGEPSGATVTDDSVWVAREKLEYIFGDYAGLFNHTEVVQEDSCAQNTSHFWAFFNGSPQTCWQWPGHTDEPVVPYGGVWVDDDEIFIHNEVWSPLIDVSQDVYGNPIPWDASITILEFDVYQDMYSSDYDMAYTWQIRSSSFSDSCPNALWGGHYWLWTSQTWYRLITDMSQFVRPGHDRMQIALGVWDLCPYYFPCNYGEHGCTHQGPFFDNVRLIRVDPKGPRWSADPLEMFQDDFPSDGSITGTVRMDTPAKLSGTKPIYAAGDSAIVYAWEFSYGLDVEAATGTPAVYLHVRSSGGQHGPDVLGDYTTYLSDDGEWTVGVCEPVTPPSGFAPDPYRCDLNDGLFLPGDSVSFYFSARDSTGRTTYFSLSGGAVLSEALARAGSDEAQCLPTGRSDVLYVDDADPFGVQEAFDDAFQELGIHPDRYDVRARPNDSYNHISSSNLAGRASPSQIVDVYRIIIWASGDFSKGTIHDGSWDIGNDVALLSAFLDSTAAFDPGLYVSGNNIIKELVGRASPYSPHIDTLLSQLGVALRDDDHIALGEPASPTGIATPSGIFDHSGILDMFPISNPSCNYPMRFDVLDTLATARAEMAYSGNPDRIATVSHTQQNAFGRFHRSVTDGFSFDLIGDDGSQALPDPADHLRDILEFLTADTAATGIERPWVYTNRLDHNYPNPFNPTTTIRYSICERQHVSLRIYNVAGMLVRTLVDGVQAPRPGGLTVEWDGTNAAGDPVSSGVYFYRLVTKGFSDTKKMVVLK